MARTGDKPYWLPGADDEICALCDSPHASVMTVRCNDCDEIICHFCVITTDAGTFYCSECTPHPKRKH